MFCYKCKKKLDISYKISFKEKCEFCDADLHVCKNCKHYIVGKPNDCNILNIDFVQDKEKNNFCEEFSYKENLDKSQTKSKNDISKKLFNESDDSPGSSFDNLFKK